MQKDAFVLLKLKIVLVDKFIFMARNKVK